MLEYETFDTIYIKWQFISKALMKGLCPFNMIGLLNITQFSQDSICIHYLMQWFQWWNATFMLESNICCLSITYVGSICKFHVILTFIQCCQPNDVKSTNKIRWINERCLLGCHLYITENWEFTFKHLNTFHYNEN